jgi:hypothetical protein
LQSCGKVRRLANDGLLLRSARADKVANNHQAGRNAYTGLKRLGVLKSLDGGDQLKPCANSLLWVVFVCLWVTEIDQDAVAHELRDETVEATYGLFNASLIDGNYVAQIFGIKATARRDKKPRQSAWNRGELVFRCMSGDVFSSPATKLADLTFKSLCAATTKALREQSGGRVETRSGSRTVRPYRLGRQIEPSSFRIDRIHLCPAIKTVS